MMMELYRRKKKLYPATMIQVTGLTLLVTLLSACGSIILAMGSSILFFIICSGFITLITALITRKFYRSERTINLVKMGLLETVEFKQAEFK